MIYTNFSGVNVMTPIITAYVPLPEPFILELSHDDGDWARHMGISPPYHLVGLTVRPDSPFTWFSHCRRFSNVPHPQLPAIKAWVSQFSQLVESYRPLVLALVVSGEMDTLSPFKLAVPDRDSALELLDRFRNAWNWPESCDRLFGPVKVALEEGTFYYLERGWLVGLALLAMFREQSFPLVRILSGTATMEGKSCHRRKWFLENISALQGTFGRGRVGQ